MLNYVKQNGWAVRAWVGIQFTGNQQLSSANFGVYYLKIARMVYMMKFMLNGQREYIPLRAAT